MEQRGGGRREDLCLEFIHPHLGGDGGGRAGAVAGKHHRFGEAASRRASMVSLASVRRGSEMQMTAERTLPMARYRREYWSGRFWNLA